MIILKCKACQYQWAEEKKTLHALFYCPKCGMIGHLNDKFILIESEYLLDTKDLPTIHV